MITNSVSLSPEQRLRNAGQRVTAQRVLLLRLLEESEGHMDAESLYLAAQEEMPDINLSTIYRNLGVLEEAGLIVQRYFARDHGKEFFEVSTATEHYHFTCVSCGDVIEFETPLIKQVRSDLKRLQGVDIRHACICFEGICPRCSAAATQQKERSHA